MQDGTNSYVYGLDLISATDGAGVQTYYTYDGLGSTTDLTDGTGSRTDWYEYDVFGAIRDSGGSSANDWLFTGEQEDGDTGLYYLRARYYDPSIGRFLGRDPIPFINRYAYVGNNPTNWTDPSGLYLVSHIGAGGGRPVGPIGAGPPISVPIGSIIKGAAVGAAGIVGNAVGDAITTVFSKGGQGGSSPPDSGAGKE